MTKSSVISPVYSSEKMSTRVGVHRSRPSTGPLVGLWVWGSLEEVLERHWPLLGAVTSPLGQGRSS